MKKIALILAMIAFLGCNKASDNNYKMEGEMVSSMDEGRPDALSYHEPTMERKKSEEVEASEQPLVFQNLKLIKTGSVTFETKDLAKTTSRINNAITKVGGYASNESENKSGYRIMRTVSIRMPSSKFDDILGMISMGVDRFDEREMSVSDVTEEYYDISARLKTKKEIEARYIQLLSRAGKITEILAVEKQIGEIRTEIDAIEGRLKYLKNQVSMSTLRISYYESLEVEAVTNNGFFSKLRGSLVQGWEMILGLILGLVSVWPLLFLGLGVLVGVRKWRNR